MSRRPTHQHCIKRGLICDWPADAGEREAVALRATYVGNAIHKTYPSPAGPPACRADEAKCDRYDRRDWSKLVDALREAIRTGCVGQFRGEFPSRAWVWINDVLHEARLSAEGQGEYHGFPLDDCSQYPLPADRLELAPRVVIP